MGINLDTYLSLAYATREPDDGLAVPNSHMPVGGPLHKRITIPWDTEYSDPELQHSGHGWTMLNGPAHYDMTVVARLWYGVIGSSVHIGFWHASVAADGTETREATQEVVEWFVGPHETSNTHIFMNWKGWLPEGQRLRAEIDNWNGDDANPIRIVAASVRGFYGRPEVVPA